VVRAANLQDSGVEMQRLELIEPFARVDRVERFCSFENVRENIFNLQDSQVNGLLFMESKTFQFRLLKKLYENKNTNYNNGNHFPQGLSKWYAQFTFACLFCQRKIFEKENFFLSACRGCL